LEIGLATYRNEGPRFFLTTFVLLDLINISTGFPAALQNLCNPLAPLSNVACFQRVHSWYQTRILDHERHQFSGIATNFEELKAIFLDELLERPMCRKADAVAIFVLQHTPQCNERLNVASRSNNMYDNIKWWRSLESFLVEICGRD
jgi:hypothetical protein